VHERVAERAGLVEDLGERPGLVLVDEERLV